MEVRDPRLLRQVTARPFPGYAVHPIGSTSFLDRVAACFALLATMVVSGVLHGTSRHQRRGALGARRGSDSMPDAYSSRATR